MLTTALRTRLTTSTTGVCRGFHSRPAIWGGTRAGPVRRGSAAGRVAVKSRTVSKEVCVLMSPLDYRRGAAPDSHPEEVPSLDSAAVRLALQGDSAATSKRRQVV